MRDIIDGAESRGEALATNLAEIAIVSNKINAWKLMLWETLYVGIDHEFNTTQMNAYVQAFDLLI